ncbi:hypothetical protein ZIOFF_003616 [Zingiber officinale]|uniref:Uncharacterized protein n=1 Tax=Zingiber officinale TaxID=94328 RepID=A0A8J5ITX3_ZINOF|nr:hypothetical protein ZIOFF_003616 [Zingiber officinale]
MYQATRIVPDFSSFINVTDFKGGKVGFTAIDNNDNTIDATFVRYVEEHFHYLDHGGTYHRAFQGKYQGRNVGPLIYADQIRDEEQLGEGCELPQQASLGPCKLSQWRYLAMRLPHGHSHRPLRRAPYVRLALCFLFAIIAAWIIRFLDPNCSVDLKSLRAQNAFNLISLASRVSDCVILRFYDNNFKFESDPQEMTIRLRSGIIRHRCFSLVILITVALCSSMMNIHGLLAQVTTKLLGYGIGNLRPAFLY